MRKRLLCVSGAGLCLTISACLSGHTPRASDENVAGSLASPLVTKSPDREEEQPRWPKGTFLVVNDQPVSRAIWDAKWRQRTTNSNPPMPKMLNEQRNRSMYWLTQQIIAGELMRQAAARAGIVVTEADRTTLRDVYGDGYERRANYFVPEQSVYASFEEATLLPILLTIKSGDATGTLAEEVDRQQRNARAKLDLEKRLRAAATIKVVGPPESLARVNETHVSRQECAKPYGGGSSVERTKLWMHGCATHKIARTLLEQETGQAVRWPNEALEKLAGPPKPVSDDEAKAFYEANLRLFRDVDVYEQYVVHFIRKDDPATRQGSVRVSQLARHFAKAVAAGEPFLSLARSYEASGEVMIKHEVVPVPGEYKLPWEAHFKTGDTYGPVTRYDGSRIYKIVERRAGPLKPFDGEAVRKVMYERDKRALLHALLEKADIEVYEEGLVPKWPEDRALPENYDRRRRRR